MNRYTRWTTALVTMGALLALSAVAWAEVKTQDPGETQNGPLTGPNCDLTGYKSQVVQFTPALAVPDNNPAGAVTPNLIFPADGTVIDDVIVDLGMTHTWIGDLRITVRYDMLCDGSIDASATLLCRPRGTAAGSPAPCGTTATTGCSADLSTASALLWSDDAVGPIAEGTCVTPVPAGCYKPTAVGGQPLSVFRGMPKNGCFTLFLADHAVGDLGLVQSWSVHIRNRPATGACCLPAGTVGCVDGSTAADCAAQGGTYLGDGTVCTPTACATDIMKRTWGGLKSVYR